MVETILTLDQAHKTGFCKWSPGQPLVLGTFTSPERPERLGAYLAAFRSWLEKKVTQWSVSVVVYEEPWIGPKTSQKTATALKALQGVIELVCFERKIKCAAVKVSEWRHHFISRNPPRDEAKKLVVEKCEKWNIPFKTEDEAEAFAIMDYVRKSFKYEREWGPETLFTKPGDTA